MLKRFVITEFYREPDENYGNLKIWYHRRTKELKRQTITYANSVDWLDTFYDENGKVHRDGDEPATLSSTGLVIYYFHGKIHRGHFNPAVIYENGRQEYWVYGEKRFETLALKNTNY
jgi:hypothetical protein